MAAEKEKYFGWLQCMCVYVYIYMYAIDARAEDNNNSVISMECERLVDL